MKTPKTFMEKVATFFAIAALLWGTTTLLFLTLWFTANGIW